MRRNKFIPILGILTGIIAIGLAVYIYTAKPAETAEPNIPYSSSAHMTELDTGTRTSYNYYGGDAYTGIQQAAADTARNVVSLAKINNKGFDVTTQAINNLSETVRNSALTVINESRDNSPDYRLPFSAILLIMGLSIITSSVRSLNEAHARFCYESEVLKALRSFGACPSPKKELPDTNEAISEENQLEESDY